MTLMMDSPANTRKEKKTLKRKMPAAPTAPETVTALVSPVKQGSTIEVTDPTEAEQLAEVTTDTSVDKVTEPVADVVVEEVAESTDADADIESPVTKAHTGGLPMVVFKPAAKDMSDTELPYAPKMSTASVFAFDDDEEDQSGVPAPALRTKPLTKAELKELDAAIDLAADLREAAEKAAKEKEAKDAAKAEAKRNARIEKRGSRRMLGMILVIVGCFVLAFGAAVPFIPWL